MISPVATSLIVISAAMASTMTGQTQAVAEVPSTEYFLKQAAGLGLSNYDDPAELNRDLRTQGRCAAYSLKSLPPRRVNGPDLALAAAYEGDCRSRAGGLVLVLWEKSEDNSWSVINLWTTPSSHAGYQAFPGPARSQPDEIKLFQDAFQQSHLGPFSASKLPAWGADKVTPNLPMGIEWLNGMERDLYEAVRAGDYEIFCTYSFTMTCFADVPGRHTQRTPILVTNGYSSLYGSKSAEEALKVLLGTSPALTATEVSARKKAMDDSSMDAVKAAIGQTVRK